MKEQYKLLWLDGYLLTDNWETVENIKKHYPVTSFDLDGDWVDCQHCWEFEASNRQELKDTVISYLENLYRHIDVFSVTNSKDEIVLTEEDIE